MIEVELGEWQSLFSKGSHTPLLQSWQYGDAKVGTGRWEAVRFKIVDMNEAPIALAQFLVLVVPLFGGLARMNRGPVLVAPQGANEQISVHVIKSLLHEAKKRRWWFVQIAPEISQSDIVEKKLSSLGLRKQPVVPAASSVLSLEKTENELLMGLKGKWRNCLRKGLKLGVVVSAFYGKSNELEVLVKRYQALQNDKDFIGLPTMLVKALAEQEGEQWGFTLFVANDVDNAGIEKSIGMLVSVRHGDTATYLIGATNSDGRRLQANYVLLWEAILAAKLDGCRWFDLGGVNKMTPEGIAHFKRGVNASMYTLVGEWRSFLFPWRKL